MIKLFKKVLVHYIRFEKALLEIESLISDKTHIISKEIKKFKRKNRINVRCLAYNLALWGGSLKQIIYKLQIKRKNNGI